MLEIVFIWAYTLAVIFVIYGILWVGWMLGSYLYGVALLAVSAIAWVGTILIRRHMRRQRILQRGTPGRVRVIRVESNSLLLDEDHSSFALTVEVLEGGPRRTITFDENIDFYSLPKAGDELEVLFDARSPDLAIIRPD